MATALATRPLVRLLPAPATDPPYDDEPDSTGWAAVASPPRPPAMTPPSAAPGGASSPGPAPPPGTVPPSGEGARAQARHRACPGVSATARTAAARFLNACLEIWNGYRPVGHIGTLCSPPEVLAIQQEMRRAVRRLTHVPSRHGRREVRRVKLRRMRVCEPRRGAVEISAVLGSGTAPEGAPQRAWAAAFRLEQRDGRWLCTLARVL